MLAVSAVQSIADDVKMIIWSKYKINLGARISYVACVLQTCKPN